MYLYRVHLSRDKKYLLMSTQFFTNRTDENSLYKKFEGIITHNTIEHFDALVGYFRASGYFQMRHLLQSIPHIRILVGINVDKLSHDAHAKGQLYLENPEVTKATFLDEVRRDIASARYRKDVEEGIVQFVEDVASGRIEMRASGDRKLHAKIYIFRPALFNEHTFGNVITGSSNFTSAGLGGQPGHLSNYEFNVLLTDYSGTKYALDEFEALWEKAQPILPVDTQAIKRQTHINDEVTPYELYLKLLMEYFGDAVDREDVLLDRLPTGYANLEYQADAVIDGYQRLMRHNGFILADVVGLGKTVIATRILKRYIQHNGYGTKVLIVFPPALATNWKSTIKDFGLSNHVHYVTNGSLHKVIDPDNHDYLAPEDYDLVVVDESHKFRNTQSEQYAFLEIICKTPRAKLGNDNNRRKKVMLLSATPLNNRPEDIANQIYLFQDARKSTIDNVPNLQSFFAPKILAYRRLKEQKNISHEQVVKAVSAIYLPIRDEVFKELVIRRTRADIERNKRYKRDIAQQQMTFPKYNDPKSVHYVFDTALNDLFVRTLELLEGEIKYYRYRAIEFIDEAYQDRYDNSKLISQLLSAIMRTRLVKRLESSFYAFKISLDNLQRKNQRMIQMLDDDKVFIAPDLDLDKYFDTDREEEIEAKIEEINAEKPNNAIYSASDFDPELRQGLEADQLLLNDLVEAWKRIDYDPKLEQFLKDLETTFLHPDYSVEGKLVIFSESTDTVTYLTQHLQARGRNDVLAIDSKNQKHRYADIQRNFDANYNKPDRADQYNIIITTEVLAEGINLHRSNVILNYDIPWNATRLMQRIGRVNRLGTRAKEIFVFNFYPTGQSEDKISLNKTALQKLQGFHAALGEDNKVYHQEETLLDNVLGDLQAQEEVNELMIHLERLRDFKEQQPDEYRRIKRLPLKSRTGRLASTVQPIANQLLGQPLAQSALTYIRDGKKEAFYIVNGSSCRELTFSSAIKLFLARPDENRQPVAADHFDWIANALTQFRNNTHLHSFNEDYDHQNLAVEERNALALLKKLRSELQKKHPLATPKLLDHIDVAIIIIGKGIFRKFRSQVAKLAKHQKKHKKSIADFLPKLEALFAQYPLAQIKRLEDLRQQPSGESPIRRKAVIVLSETFS